MISLEFFHFPLDDFFLMNDISTLRKGYPFEDLISDNEFFVEWLTDASALPRVNPFQVNVPFLYPLENIKGF